MQITAQLVKDLREITGAGMMDCKKALVATEGNIEKAIVWLREKGISKAEKKSGRIAAEGVCEVRTEGNKAILFELNCETDFVAKNEKFVNLVKKIGDVLIASDATCNECALDVEIEGKPLKEALLEQIASIGENISFRRFEVVTKTDDQVFGSYVHMGGKIASLVVLNGSDAEAARDISMHVAAINPQYISSEEIPAETIAKETEILKAEALNENAKSAKPKPENIIEKMVTGRLNKNFQAICLLSQPFVKNPDMSVEQFAKSKGVSVALFRRLAVGEGIEKKEENFADEVMKQVG